MNCNTNPVTLRRRRCLLAKNEEIIVPRMQHPAYGKEIGEDLSYEDPGRYGFYAGPGRGIPGVAAKFELIAR